MQQRTLTILVSIIIVLSLLAIGIFYLSDPTTRKPSIISGTPTIKKDIGGFFPIGGERTDISGSSTYRFMATTTKLRESVVDFSGRSFKDYLKLVRLVDLPVAGAIFLGNGSSSNLYFITADSGQINLVDFNEKVSKPVVNTEQKGLHDTLWGNDGKNLLFISRLIRGNNPIIYSNMAPTTVSDTPATIRGSAIGRDIRAITVAPNKKDIFSLEADSDGYVVGNISTFNFDKRKAIYSSPLAEWNLAWPESNTITLQTRAAANVPGFLYFLNPSTKETKRILGEVMGLTTLTSPSGKSVLMSESNSVGYNSYLFNISKNQKTPVSLRALPEKCVWTADSSTLYCAVPTIVPAGEYPDDWYRGEVKFNDSLWQINVADGKTTLLNSPSASLINEEMDATGLFLNPIETRLFFTNKRDRSLWMLDLENNY